MQDSKNQSLLFVFLAGVSLLHNRSAVTKANEKQSSSNPGEQ